MKKRERGKERQAASVATVDSESLNKPISRRSFMKAGLAVGTVTGVSVLATAGRSSLQALQVTQPSQPAAATDPFAPQQITFNVNGVSQTVLVEPRDTLANVLRDTIGLIGTKISCNRMECGSCTVLVDGVPHESCQYLALWAAGRNVLTVEGGIPAAAPGSKVAPDPVVTALQDAWVQQDGGQCCFCSPGMIMSATALLKQNPNPSVDDIKTALSGNLCRCGNYMNIIASIQLAAKNLGGG